VLPKQTVVDVLVVRVKIVKDYVSVARMASGKYDDLEVFAEVFDDLLGVGSDVDARFDDFACREGYGKLDIIRRSQSVIAVNEGLVQVEDD